MALRMVKHVQCDTEIDYQQKRMAIFPNISILLQGFGFYYNFTKGFIEIKDQNDYIFRL